jgi:membrane fusion protein, macrolide-specific efflux system
MSAEAAPLTAARKRKGRWATVMVVVLFVAVAGAAGYTLLKSKTSSSGATVSTATVKRDTIKVLVSGTGSAVVADSVAVNPQISGTVQKLYVSLGETVSAGDDLYTISSESVDTQLLQAKASLLQSEQSQEMAKQSLQQAKNQRYAAKTTQIKAQQNLDALESQPSTTPGVANQITIAKREVTNAKSAYTAAGTAVSAAEIGVQVASANLNSAQQSYDDAVASTNDTVVKAPIDGVVTALPLSVGSAVTAGTTSSSNSSSGGTAASSSSGSSSSGGSAGTSTSTSSGSSLTISDVSNLKVQVAVSEVDVPSLKTGQTAAITFDAISDRVFVGTVGLISPNGTSSSGVVSYDVDLTLAAQDPSLKPDMTATADIETLVAENILVVPSTAVKTDGTVKYVEVVDQAGTVSRSVVTVGVSNDSYTEVKSGVTEGVSVSTGAVASATASASSSSKSSSAGGGFMMGGGAPPSGGPPGGN